MPPTSAFEPQELEGKTVICAADQDPFELGHNVFCVLTPLILEDGRRFDTLRETFPNRGRVWWMVRHDLNASNIAPGCICEVKLERAVDYDSARPDKDYFQARRRDAIIGSRNFLEVLAVESEPRLGDLLRPAALTSPHQPTSRVFVGGPKSLMGPFNAEWDPKTKHVTLKAAVPGQPMIFQVKRSALSDEVVQEFKIQANQWCKHEPTRDVTIALIHARFLEQIEAKGTPQDAADDNQVLNWGLRLLDVGNHDPKVLREVLDRVPTLEVGENEPPGRLQRFLSICQSATRVVSLGEQIAAAIAAQPAFEELVRTNLEKITKDRIDIEVQARRDEIEAQAQDSRDRLARLQADFDQLQAEYQRKDQELAVEFNQEHELRIEALAKRERQVSDMEARLEQWQGEMETRLEKTAASFRTDLGKAADELIAHVPLWRKLGILGDGGTATTQQEKPRAPVLPGFLQHDRERGNLSEVDFIEQFANVAAQRGFVFHRDDLANFHLSVKTGFWTLLAGASGTGKSSLPRCYAEALGVSEELLWIPVRPDWMDDRDVLGGFNAFLGRFEPAATGFVDRLIAAHEDEKRKRGGIYLVCLDELNLARIEHYFASFLSVSEQSGDRRVLELFARSVARSDDPYAPYRQVPIAENLRMIGTINVDETTHSLTPKILDRASVLVLEEPDLAASLTLTESARPGGLIPVHAEDYRTWSATSQESPTTLHEFVIGLADELKKHGAPLGHRAVHRILNYVGASRNLFTEDRALDFACAQMILPRLRANSPRFRPLIDRLREILPESRFARTGRLLEALAQAEGEYDFFQIL
jgi:energy-coupling factor transporter ATP-binding protein EcfA2